MRAITKFLINLQSRDVEEAALGRTTLVFSPHPDDETLGCGGTIIKKKRANSDVKVFFMTNGEKSHPGRIEESQMARVRTKEAHYACRSLGLSDDDLYFFGFKDTMLWLQQKQAISKVKEAIIFYQPEEVYVPYSEFPKWSTDHIVTNRIVWAALQGYKHPVTIYEYPVWLWFDEPWHTNFSGTHRQLYWALKQRLTARYNMIRDFHHYVDITEFLDVKRAALNMYKSQVSKFNVDSLWSSLSDISGGQFLECFLHKHEIFSIKTYEAATKTIPTPMQVFPILGSVPKQR
jgi:LmbE family N-acetylglucosaminyl deacetylase